MQLYIAVLCAAAALAGVQMIIRVKIWRITLYGKDDISAQEEAQNFGSWLQSKNGNSKRTQGPCKEKSEGQKADRCLRPVALRFNFEFSRVYRYGKFASGKFLSVHAMKRHPGTRQSGYKVEPVLIRTGFCANKRELGAVGRNRARRLLREAFRTYESNLPKGIDIVFTYRGGKDIPPYRVLLSDLDSCLARLHLKGDR